MKSWELTDEVRDNAALSERVGSVRPLVEDVLGPSSSALVRARWSLSGQPDGQRWVILNISDWTYPGGVEARFASEEFGVNLETRWKVHRLWGDLLQARNHQQLAELQAGD